MSWPIKLDQPNFISKLVHVWARPPDTHCSSSLLLAFRLASFCPQFLKFIYSPSRFHPANEINGHQCQSTTKHKQEKQNLFILPAYSFGQP